MPGTGVEPEVSVLVPCFNAERYLRETLESALGQEGVLSEVVAVDDGSTDGTAQVLRSFGERVRWVRQENAGVSAARNRLMRMARGQFFQFVDADDVLAAGTLRRRLDVAQASGADVVVCWWDVVSEDGAALPQRQRSQRLRAEDLTGDVELAAFTWLWAPPVAVLYARELAERVGEWRTDMPVIQDARFLFDALRLARKAVVLEEVGARYRVHEAGSVSSRSRGRFFEDVLRNGLQIAELWQRSGALTAERRAALGECFEGVARVRLEEGRGDFCQALELARKFAGRVRGKKLLLAEALRRAGLWQLCRGFFSAARREGGRV